jgi:hypothetical protein
MAQDEAQKKLKKTENGKDLAKDKSFTEAIKIMANTPPISNEEIVKRSKKRKN